MKEQINLFKPHFYFFIIFSVSFFLIKLCFVYLLPFIIGCFLSFLMYPVYSFMKKRLSFKPAFSASVITLLIFLIFIVLVAFMIYLLISEALNLYYNNIDFFKNILSGYNIIDVIKGISVSDQMLSTISNTAFAVVRFIPISITLIIVSFVFTVFLINNFSKIINSFINKFSDKNRNMIEAVIDKARFMLNKFIRSYFILYLITFVESLFIFMVIDIDYPLVFAFLTSVADILPILGPGAVYFPIAIVRFLYGDILSAVTLAVFWGIVVIIRQIVEPKIVSDSVKMHPLVILSALYFSIVSSNIWVLFYIVLFALVYKILVEAQILKTFFDIKRKDKTKDY